MINALEGSGFAYTLARPSLVALSGQSATFLAGGEVPIPVPSSGSDNVSIEYKEFGIRLTLTPTVVGRDRIMLKVARSERTGLHKRGEYRRDISPWP